MMPPLCLVGLVGNLLCVVVLTRRHMRKPFNTLLAILALSDAFALLNLAMMYALQLKYRYDNKVLDVQCNEVIKYLHLLFLAFNKIFGRNINSWLTVSIACVRLYFITRKTNSTQFTHKHVAVIVACVVLVATPSHIPIYFVPKHFERRGRQCITMSGVFSFNVESIVHFISISIPSVLMMILSVLILVVICKGAKRRQRLTQTSRQTNRQTVRATIMILAMIFMSLLSVVPLVVFYMDWYEIVEMSSWTNYYTWLFMEIFMAVNCSVDILLFSISSEFFNTLKSLFTCHVSHVSATNTTELESLTIDTSV